MIANLLIASSFTFIGIVIGAFVLDRYHERQRILLAADVLDAHHQLATVREQLARAEKLVEALSVDIARRQAQRSAAEALHAERIRNALEAARWN